MNLTNWHKVEKSAHLNALQYTFLTIRVTCPVFVEDQQNSRQRQYHHHRDQNQEVIWKEADEEEESSKEFNLITIKGLKEQSH